MIGILIIAHGAFGESLIHSASHVMGKRPQKLRSLAVHAQDSPETLLREGALLIQELDSGQGVLILSDMCGATPCNVGASLRVPGRVELVSGANLPMLVRALTYRESPLEVLISKALTGGIEGVMHHAVQDTVISKV